MPGLLEYLKAWFVVGDPPVAVEDIARRWIEGDLANADRCQLLECLEREALEMLSSDQ